MKRLCGLVAMSLAYSACKGPDSSLPEAYRRLAVPAARLESPEARERGRGLFLEHCALCHGDRADGRGVRRQGLSSQPRDFTDAAWRERTSPRRVFSVIREGSAGTAMPAWKALDDGQIWDLAAYLLAASRKP